MCCNLGYQPHHAADGSLSLLPRLSLVVESLGRRLMVVYICHEHDLLKKSYDLLEGWEGLAATASDPITLPTKFLMGCA